MNKYLLSIATLLLSPFLTMAHGGGHGCSGHSGSGHGSCHGGDYFFVYGAYDNSKDVSIHYITHNGTVTLEGGTVLKGMFKYDWWELPTYNFIYYADSNMRVGKISWKKVDKLVLAGSDSALSYRHDSTEFYRLLNCKGFYRKLTSGKIEVYDGLANVTEMPGTISNNDIVVKYNGSQTRFHSVEELNKYIASIIPGYTQQAKDENEEQINLIQLFAAVRKYNAV